MHGALVATGTQSGAVYIYHLDGDWKDQVRTHQFTIISSLLWGCAPAVIVTYFLLFSLMRSTVCCMEVNQQSMQLILMTMVKVLP